MPPQKSLPPNDSSPQGLGNSGACAFSPLHGELPIASIAAGETQVLAKKTDRGSSKRKGLKC